MTGTSTGAHLVGLTAQIVSAHASQNAMAADALPTLPRGTA